MEPCLKNPTADVRIVHYLLKSRTNRYFVSPSVAVCPETGKKCRNLSFNRDRFCKKRLENSSGVGLVRRNTHPNRASRSTEYSRFLKKRRGRDSNSRDGLSRQQHFQCCAFGHSATSPKEPSRVGKKSLAELSPLSKHRRTIPFDGGPETPRSRKSELCRVAQKKSRTTVAKRRCHLFFKRPDLGFGSHF